MDDEMNVSMNCTSDELLVLCGSLLESEELLYGRSPDVWVATILMTSEDCDTLFDFLKDISRTRKESDYPTTVSLPLKKWKGILHAIRFVSDRNNDIWDELDSRTGCSVEQFDAFAERLESALAGVDAETQPEVSK